MVKGFLSKKRSKNDDTLSLYSFLDHDDVDDSVDSNSDAGPLPLPAPNANAIKLELRCYRESVKSDEAPLTWWAKHEMQFPHIARIAKKLLCCPVTSVPSERLFSWTGFIVDKRHASLLPENVEKLACAKSWLSVLRDT